MKFKFLILFICLWSAAILRAQPADKNDKQLIERTLQMYFDGWATGDTIKLGKAMHASCQLKTYRDGKFNDVDRAKYLSYFQPHEREKGVKTKIVEIDYTANIASATTQILTDKYLFTDYLHLIKTDDGWVIVDKIAYRFDK
ncbi:MAG: nuclear transport factor 2 family protein [Saprospiraceae bacterium]